MKPQAPALNKLRERIAQLRRINLENADIDFLKKHIDWLSNGYGRVCPILNVRQRLYRGVKLNYKPSKVCDLHHPPKPEEQVTKYGRANKIGESRFYCSVGYPTPFCEMNIKTGDFIALSRWEVKNKFFINVVGDKEFVLKKLNSNRTEAAFHWNNPTSSFIETPSNQLVGNFYANEFTKIVPEGKEDQHKLSIAIAENLMGNVDRAKSVEIPSEVCGDSIVGLLYPSIAMWGNADNLVLKPEAVANYLRLVNVEYIQIGLSIGEVEKKQFYVTTIDFADSFSGNGEIDCVNNFSDNREIEWKGRKPEWQLDSSKYGNEVKVSNEHGEFVVRDMNHNIINPS